MRSDLLTNSHLLLNTNRQLSKAANNGLVEKRLIEFLMNGEDDEVREYCREQVFQRYTSYSLIKYTVEDL